ncbi:MAG TPA: sulfatase-like hydrolase/transferase [Steroidobacteraceae bacterium]|nr:sulfatase-like hydrolase/transferase [Steroidobacteraceae bacterium]
MSETFGNGRRYRPWLLIVSVYLVIGLLTRLVLWARFGIDADVTPGHVPWIVGAGAVNDVIEALYLFAPLALYLGLMPDRWFSSAANRALLPVVCACVIAGLLYLAAAEFFFFEEFDARFNIVAFDYLAYPTEVFTDIREAYPVGEVLLASLLCGAAAAYASRGLLRASTAASSRLRDRLAFLATYAVAVGLAVGFYPTDTLSWSPNRVENELVQNGSSSFFRAARTRDIDYADWYLTGSRRQNLDELQAQLGADGSRFTRLREGRLDRRHAARPDGLGPLNVVVIVSESFGAEFSRLHGARRDWTPNFDAYARRGLWFSNAYASGTRTVRGLEAITASFPPIPTVSILRRPGSEHIATWGSVMRRLGYRTSFLYGGYAYFDDMNRFYAGNGYEVLDRANIDAPRYANVWGVSDEDLFDLALTHFGRQAATGEPFFSIVMTTSNHKPFSFRTGLEPLGIPPQGGGRKAGVRYADYALGYFLRRAARQPWFDDTLFVVVADHGARVYGKAEIPLETYEIPLMMYSPKHLAPRSVDVLTTQIDVAPTVLGLLGLPYEAPFFGVDVLHQQPGTARVALFSHNHDVALLRDDRLAVLELGKKTESLRYDRAAGAFVRQPDDAQLVPLAVAYFQTAAELFRAHQYD